MRILVNAVSAKMGGALRHLDNFLRVLEKPDSAREYWIYVDPGLTARVTAPNVHLCPVAAPRKSLLHRLQWDQITIPQLLKKHKIDTMLSILNFGPIRPFARQIVFQRNPLYYCDHYLKIIKGRERADTLLRRWFAYKTMQASEVIVTPTAAMRDMIRGIYPNLAMDKFRVIYHGFDRDLFWENAGPLPDRAARLLENVEADAVKLLYATHPAKHKGFDLAFQTLKCVRDAGVNAKLFLTTDLSDWPAGAGACRALIASLSLEDHVVMLGRIPQESMAKVYKACEIFFFPSWCESFGFTMLEAMSAGLPVVAAHTSVNREICADAALYYPPFDVAQAAQQILRVIDAKDTAQRLSRASLARVQSFDWSWNREVSEVLSLMS